MLHASSKFLASTASAASALWVSSGLVLGSLVPARTVEPQAQAPTTKLTPPGLVLVSGGQTTIGTKVEQVKAIIEQDETKLGVTFHETPQHTMRVDDYFLMVSELTNEQYAAFVKATGHRPPEHWGAAAIEQARAAFLEEQGRLKAEARKEGRTLESKVFDGQAWWNANWQGKTWAIPAKSESRPVVYVHYADALAYSGWAGLRLPTEFEFQRAARGDSARIYPWGDEWDRTKAASIDLKAPQPVGSFPLGARDGLYDLCGNVWEWTSSPVEPYPGHKNVKFEFSSAGKKKTLEGIGRFDANQRVAMGGCFQVSPIACRVTTRRPTDRTQTTDALGFRCAASPQPGVDKAAYILATDFPRSNWPENVKYDPTKCAGADRWKSSAGTAKTQPSAEGAPAAMPGYAVIEGHDHFVFVPAVELDTITVKGLGELGAREGWAHLGVYSCSLDAVQPKLKKGTYLVAYRPAGKPVEASAPAPAAGAAAPAKEEKPKGIALAGAGLQDPPAPPPTPAAPVAPVAPKGTEDPAQPDAAAATASLPEGLNPEEPNLLFLDLERKPVAFLANPDLEMLKPAAPSASRADGSWRHYEIGASGKPEQRTDPVDVMNVKVFAWCKVSNKAVGMRLPFYFAKGSLEGNWRN